MSHSDSRRDSRRDSRVSHTTPGRSGPFRTGPGRNCIIIVTFRTARGPVDNFPNAVPDISRGTATDMMDITLADLDWDPTIPCTHSQHPQHPGDEPAAWVVIILCPECERVGTYLLCEPGRLRMVTGTVGCPWPGCGATGDYAEWVISIESIRRAA